MTPLSSKVAPINASMLVAALTLLFVWISPQVLEASPQASETPKADEAAVAKPIEILDDPKSLDPATLMEPRLAAPTTVEFDKVSMKEFYRWLQEEQKLSVSVDATAMKDKGILSSELFSDRLDNEPLYLILDRLKSLGIGWYVEDGDLFLTTTDAASQKMMTVSYNLGELLDAGFEGERIVEAISSATGSTLIEQGDKDGAVVLLGDVVFVRQTQQVQREVRGLLAGLKKTGRRTLTMSPPQHALLREKLLQKISTRLEEIPLSEAIAVIAAGSGADIRINAAELKKAGVRDRTPISIEMTDQKLNLVLQSVLSDLKLTWLVQDGVIWVVQNATAESATRTAIYDVRDLCRDAAESEALMYALMEQAGGSWEDNGDKQGVLLFARSGILVVRHTEQMLDNVLQLLENYRTALRESKPRKKLGPDPKEVVTYYYRLPTEMAKDFQLHMPELVRPGTWKSENNPDAQGTVMILKSTSDLQQTFGKTAVPSKGGRDAGSGYIMVVDNSVLIIRHMREVHEEIDSLLDKLTTGERPVDPNAMGGMQGGFGGGFFDVR